MRRELLPDGLWNIIEPLLPPHHKHRLGGRPPVKDRKALAGIILVLKTGMPWEDLPREMGCSGMTCWRRLRTWQRGGAWEKVKRVLLAMLREADRLDFSRAVVDSGSVRAVGGGRATGPNPTDRRKPGSKHHVITEAHGIPLATILTGANRHDVTQLLPLVEKIPPVAGKRGRPRRRPDVVQGDRAYDSEPHRAELKKNRSQARAGRAQHDSWKRVG
jgi:transposase